MRNVFPLSITLMTSERMDCASKDNSIKCVLFVFSVGHVIQTKRCRIIEMVMINFV